MNSRLVDTIKNWKGSEKELNEKLLAMLKNNEVTPEEVGDALYEFSPFPITCPTVAASFSVEKDRENGNTSAFCC